MPKKKKNPHLVYMMTAVAKIVAYMRVENPLLAKEWANNLVVYLRKLGLVD